MEINIRQDMYSSTRAAVAATERECLVLDGKDRVVRSGARKGARSTHVHGHSQATAVASSLELQLLVWAKNEVKSVTVKVMFADSASP